MEKGKAVEEKKRNDKEQWLLDKWKGGTKTRTKVKWKLKEN